jgi:hypothetical protein
MLSLVLLRSSAILCSFKDKLSLIYSFQVHASFPSAQTVDVFGRSMSCYQRDAQDKSAETGETSRERLN